MNWNDIETTIERIAAEWRIPGIAVGIVQDDALVYARGFGVRTVDRPEPVDAHTLFAIASCTKAFTAAGLAVLVDEKRLTLDDPVSRYLPDFQLYDPYVTRELTVRDLLCHRSGLKTFSGDLVWFGTTHSRDEILRRARYIKPFSSFRSQFGYQNIMFVAAGKIIETISGLPWGDFLRQRFLNPLGMADTTTSVTQLAGRPNVASPHIERSGRILPIDYVNIDNQLPAGGLNSSVADMAQWIRLQLNQGRWGDRALISPEMIQEMWTPHTLAPAEPQIARLYPSTHFRAYGLGWFMCDYMGRKVIEHSGGLPGFVSLVTLVPEQNLGFVILTSSETSAISVIRNTIFDLVFDAERRDWPAEFQALKQAEQDAKQAADQKQAEARAANTRPSLPLEGYAGCYTGSLYGDVNLSVEDGRLVLRMLPAPTLIGDLEHWHYDTFRVSWREPYFPAGLVTFLLDARGVPVEMKIDAPNRDFDFTELELKRVES